MFGRQLALYVSEHDEVEVQKADPQIEVGNVRLLVETSANSPDPAHPHV
jgi:hypothetical protein